MAYKDVKNSAYLALIALAESGSIRKALVGKSDIYFADATSVDALKALGIEPVSVGDAIVRQLQKEGIYDHGQHPLTFTREAVRAAIEAAEPRSKSNYLLASSVGVNTQDLPYTEATQHGIDCRKMMNR